MNTMSLQDQERLMKELDAIIPAARENMKSMAAVKYTDPTTNQILKKARDSMTESIELMEKTRVAARETHRSDTNRIKRLQDLVKKAEHESAAALDHANKATSLGAIKTARASAKRAEELHKEATSIYKGLNANQQNELNELKRRIEDSKAKAKTAATTAAELEKALYEIERAQADIKEALNASERASRESDPKIAKQHAAIARGSVRIATAHAKSLEGSSHAYIIKIVSEINSDVANATAKIDAWEKQALRKEEQEKARLEEARQKEAQEKARMEEELGNAKRNLIDINSRIYAAAERVKSALQVDNDLEKAIKAEHEVRAELQNADNVMHVILSDGKYKDPIMNQELKELAATAWKLSEGASLLITQETVKAEKAKAAAAKERDQVTVLKDGLRYILTNTRRCAYDASSVTDDQDVRKALGTYEDTLSVMDSRDKDVPDLENDQAAVGAVLFDGNDYAGVALPIVVREVHKTKLILVREKYTRHVMITASERQVAVSLGYTHAYRSAPSTGAATANTAQLTERFLEHMFLDDMCVLDGSSSSTAVRNFQVCIDNIGVKELTKITLAAPAPDQTKVDKVRTKTKGEAYQDYIKNVLQKYIENDNKSDGDLDAVTLMPIGYYDEQNKKGHQAAILVVKQGDHALVAISDTGETAMNAAYADHYGAYKPDYKGLASIVAIGKADIKTARGILEFAKVVLISGSTELEYTRKAILMKCNVDYYYETLGLSYIEPNMDMVVREDRHLAVQVLLTADNRILSHTQRGGTCTFYSILWLLGIAYALTKDAKAVDHVIAKKTTYSSVKPTKEDRRAKSEALRAKSAALIDSIGDIDKKIKAFAFSQLDAHRRVAELVAADYAGCSWLDTKALRERLVLITNTEVAPTFVAECKIERKQPRVLSYDGDPCKSLEELSKWIDDHGWCPNDDIHIIMRYAISAAFVHRARNLLIKPMNYKASATDTPHILRISTYVSHVRRWSIVTMDDTLEGMAMRCIRLIIAIVKLRPVDQLHKDPGGRVIMPATFYTSLPWAASEYYALQNESKEVAGFMFDAENMMRMSEAWKEKANEKKQKKEKEAKEKEKEKKQKNAKEKEEGTIVPIGDRILSTNTFHKGWIDKKNDDIAANGLSAEARADIRAKIQSYETQIAEMTALQLTDIQLDALEYIRHNEDIAVLNVASALLLNEDNFIKTQNHTHFIFGYKDRVLFCASRHYELEFAGNPDGYKNNHSGINNGVSLTTQPRYSASEEESHAEMAQNMAYLHDATRDCAAKEPRNHEAENADLYLSLTYPPKKVTWDIDSLVAWADTTNGSCVYDGRSVEYVLRRHVIPISADGPTDAAVSRLQGKVGSAASTPASPGCKDVLAATEDLLGGTVKLPLKIHKDRDWEVALLAFMTIAAHTRKTGMVMGLLGIATSTTTDPPSSWSLTPITANATFVRTSVPISVPTSDTTSEELFKLHFSATDTRRFVFDAKGGGMAKVHRRLLGAGVRFDHWMKNENNSTIQTRDAMIENVNGKISVKMGERKYGVFTQHCEWWDSTYKAAVLPIGPENGKVEKLVVFPGEIEHARPDSRYPSIRVVKDKDKPSLHAYLASLPKQAFVLDLDTVGVMPAATTGDGKVQDTDKLVLLFVAYAYAGSRLGTRLMPCVASRAISDEREIVVHGAKSVLAHEAIRLAILDSSCPLGAYSELALIRASPVTLDDTARAKIASALRCKNEDLRHRLVARLRSSSVYDHTDPATRARFSFWAEYGEPERIKCHEEAMKKAESDRDEDKKKELARLQAHTDEWMTVLSATTGRFVRADQREMIGLITSDPATWRVVQMGMGFGKSSVIVPMLVARYISMEAIRIVFVTQPPHLVPQAARTVGALIAAHPFVGHKEELKPVYVISVSDLRAIDTNVYTAMSYGRLNYKLVVVLSTADLQSLVRDTPVIYALSDRIAHIADEVDSESDPMRCEVIIAGDDTALHYDEKVAENIATYYAAACELGFGMDARAKISELDEMSSKVKAGTRLQNVFNSVRRNMDHRVHYGMSDDDSKILAVPFEYAGTPSRKRLFSDIDVEVTVAVDSIKHGMRLSDWDRLLSYIRTKFRGHAERVIKVIGTDQELARRYYLTEYALRHVQMSKSEIAVSFLDLLGVSQTFVGFSGTMGASIEEGLQAPTFAKRDVRSNWCSGKKAEVTADVKSNDLVKHVIQNAKCLFVGPEDPGVPRATAVIRKIKESMQTDEYEGLHAVIVDGSGEFGAFDDDLGTIQSTLGRNVEYFGNDGVLVRYEKNKRITRYYSHRNSRGVDSVMPVDTVSFTVMSEKKSRYSDITQAVFRLRELKKEGPSQKVVLVVVKDSASSHTGEYDGNEALRLLVTNEQNYGKSAAITKEKQKEHASTVKSVTKDFKRAVVYLEVKPDDDAPAGTAQKQQTQVSVSEAQKQQEQEAHQERTITRDTNTACYERLKEQARDDQKLTLANHFTKTTLKELQDSLVAINVGLSPMIMIRELTKGVTEIRRAFAVNEKEVVALTVVEAWAKYAPNEGTYSYYTYDGALISSSMDADRIVTINPGRILLGRFLCDNALSIDEEALLLAYLAKEYTNHNASALTAVIKCLRDSKFLSYPHVMLKDLDTKDARAIIRANNAEDLAKAVSAGSPILYNLFLPIITGALKSASSFGRAIRRTISRFI